jgi:hypothetical protein
MRNFYILSEFDAVKVLNIFVCWRGHKLAESGGRANGQSGTCNLPPFVRICARRTVRKSSIRTHKDMYTHTYTHFLLSSSSLSLFIFKFLIVKIYINGWNTYEQIAEGFFFGPVEWGWPVQKKGQFYLIKITFAKALIYQYSSSHDDDVCLIRFPYLINPMYCVCKFLMKIFYWLDFGENAMCGRVSSKHT